MSVRADGQTYCDRCGGEVGGGTLTHATNVQALASDGTVAALHFCTVKDDTHDRCVTKVLSRANLRDYLAANGDAAPSFYERGGALAAPTDAEPQPAVPLPTPIDPEPEQPETEEPASA